MADPVLTIQDRIREIMLAEPALDALKVVYRGVPHQVPVEYYPFGIVAVTEEDTATPMTGGRDVVAYLGTIAVNVLGRDLPVPNGRAADVSSYDTVITLVNAIKRLFRKPANGTLGDLADPGGQWVVTGFYIGDGGSTVYGYAEMEDRPNNYENYGLIPFICTIQEAAT